MQRSNLKKVAISQSLIRPNLILDGEKSLVIVSMLFAVIIPYATFTVFGFLLSSLLGVIVWLGLMIVVRSVTKSDFQFRLIFSRHISYRGHYPALSDMKSIDRKQRSAFD